MSFCDYHPDREAVGRCSVCGKNVCRECSGNSDGAIVCAHCRSAPHDRVWVSSKQPSPSPWDTSQHMDKRTHNYLIIGMVGAFLWFFVNVVNAYINVSMMSYPSYSIFLNVVPLLNVANVVSLFYPVLFGVGFLGLSVKYNEQYARYVFYAYVGGLLMMLISQGFMGAYILYSPSMLVLLVPGLLYGAIMIITIVLGVFSLWRLRSKSNHGALLVCSAVLWCLYIPLPYLVVLLTEPAAYYLAFYGLQSLLAILMVGVFYLESRVEREGLKTVRTW